MMRLPDLIIAIFLLTLIPALGAEPQVYHMSARYSSKQWIKASAPPPNWNPKFLTFTWLEYYFPESKSAVVIPINIPTPRAYKINYAWCFQVKENKRYSHSFHHGSRSGGPSMIVKSYKLADLHISTESAKQYREIIKEHAAKHTPLEDYLLLREKQKTTLTK